MNKILFLEDDQSLRASLVIDFQEKGYATFEASKIAELPSEIIDYAVIDLRLNGDFGLNAISKILENSPNCKIVILTGYGSISTAVEALKLGAINYLSKPVSSEQIEMALLGKRDDFDKNLENMPTLSQKEHEYIDYVLTQNNGNISRTAKILGLHRQSLQRKLKKYP